MVPLQDKDRKKFALPFEGIQYTITRLPQDYKHSPVTAHTVFAEFLQTVSLPQDVKFYQCDKY